MGILRDVAAIVRRLPLPKGFSVCELGDQWMAGLKEKQLARDWFLSWGCGRYVSIDGNGKGTLLADLNFPVPLDPFDLVTDFGTGEHVFDQAQVWRTLHDLTKPGGYIAFDRPAQGYDTHCFYRTDPCLYHDIAAANGYRVDTLITADTPRGELIRGVFQRNTDLAFRIPQQGRYLSTLVIR
jgi:SAM-dependent methyltransferase